MGLKPDLPLRLPTVRIEDQFAVLVGGYADIDAARRGLERVKKMQPPRTVPKDVLTYDLVPPPGSNKPGMGQKAFVNPFLNSFVVPNPTVQVAREDPHKPDPFWKELNAGESLSLLKCRKPWTLAIKEYQQPTVYQPQSAPSNFLDKLLGNAGEQLNAQAMTAHNFAEALRKLGFEAYVLHTRGCSIVTLGGYDGPDDPRLKQMQRAVPNIRINPPVELFAMPMEVPRL
jgi:hypothetical protein